MKKITELIIILFIIQSCGDVGLKSIELDLKADCVKELASFKHYSIQCENDTINYHVFSNSDIEKVENILLFIHGSGAMPLYQVKRVEKGLMMSSSVPFSMKKIPDNYLFVIISKKGIPFCTHLDDELSVPKEFYENETLEYRANQANLVIQDLIARRKDKQYKKIIALGHSEGSDVIAKLGTINKSVSHFGFWCGSGNSQLYDFTLFIRQDVNRGKITEEEGIEQMDSLFEQYRDIVKNKDNIEKNWLDNSYKRWYYFSEPPIENLLKIDKPIFVAMGTADKSVPIESIYLIPVEFIRRGKDNLSFNVYPHLEHNFDRVLENGERERNWNKVFYEFLDWTDK